MKISNFTKKYKSGDTTNDLPNTKALPFRLLKLTNLVSRPFYGQLAKQHSLSLNEWRTIYVLASNPGMSAVEISAATGLQQMNISRALAGLRKSAHIVEAPDPRDMRRTLVSLTRSGLQAFQEIASTAKAHTNMLFETIPKDQLEIFSNVVDQLIIQAEKVVENQEKE